MIATCRGVCEHGLVCVLEAGHVAPCSPMRGFCQCNQPTRIDVSDDEIVRALERVNRWMYAALAVYEGEPAPSENEGKNAQMGLIDAIDYVRRLGSMRPIEPEGK